MKRQPALDVTLALDRGQAEGAFRVSWIGEQYVREARECVFSQRLWDQLVAARQATRNAPLGTEYWRELGRELLNCLMPGEIRALFQTAYRTARQNNRFLRLRLMLAPELQNLPFELLYDDQHNLFLAANEFILLVRSTTGTSFVPPPIRFPLKCLIIAPEVNDAPVSVDHEIAELKQHLKDLIEVGFWQLSELRGRVTIAEVRDRARTDDYDILHFIGHGVLDERYGQASLVLTDEQGRPRPVDTTVLVNALAGFTRLSLVVLNCCHGGHSIGPRPYASIAERLAQLDVAAVIAMHREVEDAAAWEFAGDLYCAIMRGLPLDKAVNTARLGLFHRAERAGRGDWFNPQIYLRSPDGQLFEADLHLPWDERLQVLLDDGNYDQATELIHKFSVSAVRSPVSENALVEQARRFAHAAIQDGDWAHLEQLAHACARLTFLRSDIKRWQALCENRRNWRRHTIEPLERDAATGDALQRTLAACRCVRLLREVYDGDAITAELRELVGLELGEKLTAQTAKELRTIRDRLGSATLPAPTVDLLDVLRMLHEQNGLPVTGSLAAGPLVCLLDVAQIQPLLVHRPAGPSRFRDAAAWIVAHPDAHADPWGSAANEWRELLGEDAAIVDLAVGRVNKAIAFWDQRLRSVGDVGKQARLHHHLALARSFAAPSVERFPALPLLSWAILLEVEEPAVAELWKFLFAAASDQNYLGAARALEQALSGALSISVDQPGDASQLDMSHASQPGLTLDRNTSWVTLPATSSRVTGGGVETMCHEAAERPAAVRWFAAERAGLHGVAYAARAAKFENFPFCGYQGLIHLRWQANLQVVAKAFERTDSALLKPAGNEDGLSPGRRLRMEFSELRLAFQALKDGEPLETVADLLAAAWAGLPASELPHAQAILARILHRGIKSEGVDFNAAAFAERNCLHERLADSRRHFANDWYWCLTTAVQRPLILELSERLIDLARISQLAQLLLAQRADGRDLHSTQQLQELVLQHARRLWAEPVEYRHWRLGLDAVCCVAEMGFTPELNAAIATDLVQLGERLVKNNDFDDARVVFSQALDWSPDSDDARSAVAMLTCMEAEHLLDLGHSEQAAAHHRSLQQILTAAPRLTENLREVRSRADQLEHRLATLQEEISSPEGESHEPNLSHTHGWRQRCEKAERALAEGDHALALEYAGDAALLAADEPDARPVIRKLLNELLASAPNEVVRQETLSAMPGYFSNSIH